MNLGEKMKPVLEKRLAVLKEEIADIDQTLREPDSQDFEERATENEGDEVLEDLGNAALTEIAQIETALERIAGGTYGDCVTCGEAIPPARLEAVPQAAQCIKCAS
ncbi:MAG: TraR/DksA family transcriptional regulator [Alphaproteobacteria bacterium]|nr:dimethylmenaquinone methyltransferase [Magnetovibrio sp.]HBT40970.1 dimethylmenaquinone methyltransferase [Rhodospirillaceae bacterium]|tara:strand:- start:843 stop:1160 length:318 start_codon:yes stop_codon:yes gene_type:complete